MKRALFLATAIAISLIGSAPLADQDRFTAVTTFTVIADMARNVAGDAANAEACKEETRPTIEPLKAEIIAVPAAQRWRATCEGAFSYLARFRDARTLPVARIAACGFLYASVRVMRGCVANRWRVPCDCDGRDTGRDGVSACRPVSPSAGAQCGDRSGHQFYRRLP